MNRRKLTWALLALWALIFLGSFLGMLPAPEGERSLDQGLARISTFFGWQMLAGMLSLPAWWAGWTFDTGTAGRWLSRLPILLTLLLVAAVCALFVFINRHPDPVTPVHIDPATVTAPAME